MKLVEVMIGAGRRVISVSKVREIGEVSGI